MKDGVAVYTKYQFIPKATDENDLDFAIAVFRPGTQIDKGKKIKVIAAHTVE